MSELESEPRLSFMQRVGAALLYVVVPLQALQCFVLLVLGLLPFYGFIGWLVAGEGFVIGALVVFAVLALIFHLAMSCVIFCKPGIANDIRKVTLFNWRAWKDWKDALNG